MTFLWLSYCSIEDSIRNREEINETDIFLLRQELLPLVIAALQKDR